ncbi:hypothetical protein PPYR_13915 [Photinus pyralis]|uniref:Uncharacterized protein n=1 Tax=Photinus pyralis TaxID=7054 RepID=A0A5N4A3N6_PHOPY|nr:uncharacterized protein LOC116181107 [Photinus pyralis]KAB0791954.1 hypothetical protein PPYR_13915 [Photinus pyralis]
MSAQLKIVLLLLPASLAFFSARRIGDVSHDLKLRVDAEHPECVARSGVDPSVADKYWDILVYPEGRPFKCYLECLYKAFNIVREDGSLNEEFLIETIETVTKEGVNACREEIKVGADGCERAFNFDSCMVAFYM